MKIISADFVALLLLALAFIWTSKKQFTSALTASIMAFVVFAIAELLASAPALSTAFTPEQFSCWLFAALFFWVAVLMLRAEKLSHGFLALLISALTFFCGLSGVQALLKTHMLWKVTNALEIYGEKLDTFQTTVANIQNDLIQQQSRLATNQMNLQLEEMNLAAQEERLNNMEYWTRSLYDNITNEILYATNKQRVIVIPSTDATPRVYFVKLGRVPIKGSLEVYLFDKEQVSPEAPILQYDSKYNIISTTADEQRSGDYIVFHCRYVIDQRLTNYYDTLPVLNRDLVFHGLSAEHAVIWSLLPPSNR